MVIFNKTYKKVITYLVCNVIIWLKKSVVNIMYVINIMLVDDDSYDSLLKENNALKETIRNLQCSDLNEKIDSFVDNWFEKHKDDIDIGRMCLLNVFGKEYEIDILPDIMEKAIYKKCIKIIISLMSSSLAIE